MSAPRSFPSGTGAVTGAVGAEAEVVGREPTGLGEREKVASAKANLSFPRVRIDHVGGGLPLSPGLPRRLGFAVWAHILKRDARNGDVDVVISAPLQKLGRQRFQLGSKLERTLFEAYDTGGLHHIACRRHLQRCSFLVLVGHGRAGHHQQVVWSSKRIAVELDPDSLHRLVPASG